jgi:ferredoxin-NADP reductase
MLTLRLQRLGWEAPGVLTLELVAPDGAALPAFTAGAHVDVHLAEGLVRQYSLCGDPAERTRWRLAVRKVEGGRGSTLVHRQLRPGALLPVSEPRNNFPLLPAARYLFIAGGIGITPLLPMLRAAQKAGTPWNLLFCARSADEAPFLAEARALGDVVLHASAEGTRLDVAATLREAQPGTQIYCCGPQGLMEAVEQAGAQWPEGSLHFEWFAARQQQHAEAGAFELTCARSNRSLTVPADRSILAVLREAGIETPSSCEEGVCGSCEVAVVQGELDHRDSILSAGERAAGRSMMVCVSRARGARLVLDI